jgi:alpha-beta hydrolase superfamily lysophospholipase
VDAVIAKTLESQPRNALEHMHHGKRNGHSQTAVSRIWRTFGLQPHRQETFKLSTDPQFVAKTRDIVDTYNENPKPFIWTKTADDILAIIERFCPRISNSQH